MAFFLPDSSKALAGTLREPSASAIPNSDQMGHYFGGPRRIIASAARTQYFQRLSHDLRFGAAGLTGNPLKKGCHLGVEPYAQLGHRSMCITICDTGRVGIAF
jgi:hypothetical protein